MSDFGTMKGRIADEMKRQELSAGSSAVQSAILSSIDYYSRRRFPWNEFSDVTKDTVASATAVTLSSVAVGRIISLDSVKVRIGTRYYPLVEKTWRHLEGIDSGQFTGYPEYYSIHGNQLRMYPPPQSVYQLVLSGLAKLEDVSAGAANTTTNAWLVEGEEMIRLHAKANLFRDHVRNPSMAGVFRNECFRIYSELNRENVGRIATGRVRPTRF